MIAAITVGALIATGVLAPIGFALGAAIAGVFSVIAGMSGRMACNHQESKIVKIQENQQELSQQIKTLNQNKESDNIKIGHCRVKTEMLEQRLNNEDKDIIDMLSEATFTVAPPQQEHHEAIGAQQSHIETSLNAQEMRAAIQHIREPGEPSISVNEEEPEASLQVHL